MYGDWTHLDASVRTQDRIETGSLCFVVNLGRNSFGTQRAYIKA